MGKADEQILVVERKVLFEGEELAFQGLESNPLIVKLMLNHINRGLDVKRRGDKNEPKSLNNMEANPDYKQPIPYVIVKQGDKYFAYKRLGGSGEQRLVDKVSIGVGGHMNRLTHEDFLSEIRVNAERELNEELKFVIRGDEHKVTLDESSVRVIGMINDDENEVGRVHIGLLIVIDFSEDFTITVRETDTLEGELLTLEELKEYYDELESWSQIAYDELANE